MILFALLVLIQSRTIKVDKQYVYKQSYDFKSTYQIWLSNSDHCNVYQRKIQVQEQLMIWSKQNQDYVYTSNYDLIILDSLNKINIYDKDLKEIKQFTLNDVPQNAKFGYSDKIIYIYNEKSIQIFDINQQKLTPFLNLDQEMKNIHFYKDQIYISLGNQGLIVKNRDGQNWNLNLQLNNQNVIQSKRVGDYLFILDTNLGIVQYKIDQQMQLQNQQIYEQKNGILFDVKEIENKFLVVMQAEYEQPHFKYILQQIQFFNDQSPKLLISTEDHLKGQQIQIQDQYFFYSSENEQHFIFHSIPEYIFENIIKEVSSNVLSLTITKACICNNRLTLLSKGDILIYDLNLVDAELFCQASNKFTTVINLATNDEEKCKDKTKDSDQKTCFVQEQLEIVPEITYSQKTFYILLSLLIFASISIIFLLIFLVPQSTLVQKLRKFSKKRGFKYTKDFNDNRLQDDSIELE